MGVLFPSSSAPVRRGGGLDLEMLHRLECNACPLNKIVENLNPHMEATGADKPLVYILGEAPGKDEDEDAEQFVGVSGELLRARIPRKFRDHIRFNNVVRTRPIGNATPERVSIECCRPSVTADIERSKPRAIFGFGNVPLDWVSGFNGITVWRGRRMPVKVGSHTCWFYPMLHPAYLLRQRRGGRGDGATAVGSEEERMFVMDLQRAFAELNDLPEPVVHNRAIASANIECITAFGSRGLAQIRDALRWAAELPAVGIDYETNGLRPYKKGAKILTAAVASEVDGVAFAFDHREAEWTEAERAELGQMWRDFLFGASGAKAVHNLAFEMEWSGYFFGTDLLRAGRWDDTATQASILDERSGKQKPGPFALEFLIQQYFGFNLKQLTGLNRSNLDEEPLDNVLLYNAMDSKYHCALFKAQRRRIRDEGLEEPYELAVRRVPTVILSQLRGVPVNQDEVAALAEKYNKRVADIERQISQNKDAIAFRRTTGREFNAQSPQDVIQLFGKILGCPECEVEDKYTKEVKYSADETVLTAIVKRTGWELPKLIIALRKAQKQKSTYIDPLTAGGRASVLWPDGQMHAQFNTFFAETGRLSCESPNLQNFPKRDGEAIEVRRPIVPVKDCTIISVDFGQIEARVIAMFTRDKRFCKALWENYDVHMEWAERLAYAYPARIGGKQNLKGFELIKNPKNKGMDEVKAAKNFRTDIKNQWTFPLFFGAKLSSAAGYLEIPEDVIRPHYEEFWEQFSGVKDWQDELLDFYYKNGYVECLTGRRRRGPLSLNQTINTPVQGTACEIVMDAMCRLSETEDPDLQAEIQIHDDLTYVRVPAARADDIAERVITEMLAVPFPWVNVPISVEMSCGPNWMELKEVGTFASHKWFKPDDPRNPHRGKPHV